MKNLDLIVSTLNVIRGCAFVNGKSQIVHDVEWTLSMVDRFKYYDPQWCEFSVLEYVEFKCRYYHGCIADAITHHENGDDERRACCHARARKTAQEIKDAMLLL